LIDSTMIKVLDMMAAGCRLSAVSYKRSC
jgi:hypothetical protein